MTDIEAQLKRCKANVDATRKRIAQLERELAEEKTYLRDWHRQWARLIRIRDEKDS